VIAAFTDFQISIVTGRELEARFAKSIGHQIQEGIVGLGQMRMDSIHHLLGGVGSCDRQHTGMHGPHHVATTFSFFGTQAARDNDFAVDVQGF